MATVLDGPQMFLVPLREIEVGEELTHYYKMLIPSSATCVADEGIVALIVSSESSIGCSAM